MPAATPGGECPEDGPGQRELIARLDAPAAIADETWTLVIRNKALTAWTGGWFDRVPPHHSRPGPRDHRTDPAGNLPARRPPGRYYGDTDHYLDRRRRSQPGPPYSR
jgi:hypothetical protein